MRICEVNLTLNPILQCNFCRIKKFSDSIAFRLIAPENTLLEANARFLSIVRIEKCSSEVLHAGTVHSALSILKGKLRKCDESMQIGSKAYVNLVILLSYAKKILYSFVTLHFFSLFQLPWRFFSHSQSSVN